MLPVTPLSRNEVLESSHQGFSGLTPDTSSINVSEQSKIRGPVQFEDEIREKRGDRTQFSISTATHDVLQTLDGYDDSGN